MRERRGFSRRTPELEAMEAKHKQEEGVRREQERIKNIFDSVPDAIIIVDLNLNVVECNPAAIDLWRYSSKSEIIGKNISDFVVDKDHQRIIKDAKEILERGLVRDVEYTCLTKKGDEFIALVSLSIVKDTSGKPIYFIATAKDITKIKLSKQRLQTTVDGIKDGISIIGKDYKILMVNSEILRIFNKRSFGDLIGKNCFNAFYNNERVCDNCLAHKTFKSGEVYNIAKNYFGINKEKIVLDISTIPIKDPDGKVIQVIEHIKNITDRINLEEYLIVQGRMVAIGELASGIAHEIRNPLGNISASAQYCLSKFKLPEKAIKYLRIIVRNSENANRVIKNLLDLAKPKEISFNMADIGEVIKNTCNLFKAKCLKQHVRLTRRLPRNLPQILLDEGTLMDAFSNFILNALEAMPDGGKLTITAYCDFQNNEVVVSFLDTGKGIPHEKLNKIFDPFFTTKKNGIGLGLYLAHQVIHDHKGKIKIESKVDQGTEVIIKLPISRR
jgi:PAS domain S-box-containing protein